MKKQILEIEVPDGKKAIWKDGRIIFDDEDTMESIKSIEDAVQFIINKKILLIFEVKHYEHNATSLFFSCGGNT